MSMVDCYVDVFEGTNFDGRWRRLLGPADYEHLLGPDGITVGSLRAGPGACVQLYAPGNELDETWLAPGQALSALPDRDPTVHLDSLRIIDEMPRALRIRHLLLIQRQQDLLQAKVA